MTQTDYKLLEKINSPNDLKKLINQNWDLFARN